jgi:hypothetical protein
MSGGRRRLGRRAETASDGGVNAGEGGEMEVSSSEGQSTPPGQGLSGQIDNGALINESDGDEVSSSSPLAGVRVHYVMKEPPKLSKLGAKDLEEVKVWRDKWARYFVDARRTDVASATMEPAALKRWNLLLHKGTQRLTDKEIANMSATVVACERDETFEPYDP